jgi:drug/metabolite transporter (DMT)-like permease
MDRPRKIPAAGLLMVFAGVLSFSLTFPATQKAMLAFNAWTVGIGRAVIAAVLAGCCLLICRVPFPGRRYAGRLLLVSTGVVIGYPLFIALALDHVDSSHAAVVTGLLPLTTAIFGRMRGGEKPSRLFWWAACAGAAVVAAYTLRSGVGSFGVGDLLLVGSLITGGFGYAEGGFLSREMPGWQVISWGLVLALPVTLPITIASLVISPPHNIGAQALAGFGYVAVFSMFLGFFAWYPGLARVGITRGSQVQLLQPLLTVGWAALLLSESISTATLVAAIGVVLCVGLAQRARLDVPAPVPPVTAMAVNSRDNGGAADS